MSVERFRDLGIGERFRFASEKQYLSMARGPWVKLSARKYRHAETGLEATVGSVNVEVIAERRANPLSRVKPNSPSMATGRPPSKRLRKRRAKTEALPPGYYANPLTRVKVRSPSQRPSLPVVAEHGDPSPRLVKRRERTAKLKRPGAYANPLPFAEVEWANLVHYLVQSKGTYHTRWTTRGVFKTKSDAHDYAHALHRADDSLSIRVISGK